MFQFVLLYGKISVQFLLRSKSPEWQGFGRVADGVKGAVSGKEPQGKIQTQEPTFRLNRWQ